MWEYTDAVMRQAIEDRLFPGCAFAAGRLGQTMHQCCLGTLTEGSPEAVNASTLYDAGELTQALTAALAMTAAEQGILTLDDPICLFLDKVPLEKQSITLYQLLTHTAGLTSHFLLPEEAQTPQAALQAILSHPLSAAPGKTARHSNLGYILLGFVLEKVFGLPLDAAFKRCVARPLGMKRACYLPSGGNIAPGRLALEMEDTQPYDRNARFLHGVAGHAGVFLPLEDLELFLKMLAQSGRTESGVFLPVSATRLIRGIPAPGLSDRLSCSLSTAEVGAFLGHFWPQSACSLLDPMSGSCIVLSPEDGTWLAFLTNSRDSAQLTRFQKLLFNTALAALEREM